MAVCLLGTPASEPCRSQASSSQEYDCVFPLKEPEAGYDREAAELNVSVSLMSQAVASCSHDGVSWEETLDLAGWDGYACFAAGGRAQQCTACGCRRPGQAFARLSLNSQRLHSPCTVPDPLPELLPDCISWLSGHEQC